MGMVRSRLGFERAEAFVCAVQSYSVGVSLRDITHEVANIFSDHVDAMEMLVSYSRFLSGEECAYAIRLARALHSPEAHAVLALLNMRGFILLGFL